MPAPLDNVIVAAVADTASKSVSLRWATGEETVHSFRHLLSKGVMKRMADPDFFAQVSIGEHGRSLIWPGELDFCADALWFDVRPQDNTLLQRAAAAG
jgi:hypothetical protein